MMNLWEYVSIALCGLLFALGVYAFKLNSNIKDLMENNAILKSNQEKYTQAIAQAEANQKIKIEYVDREVKVIETQTQEKVKEVKKYVYDTNKSMCENSLKLMRNSGF